MVRCSADRVKTRYDAECVNARQAAQRVEVKEDAARRAAADALSESKRLALRESQEAAAQARRVAADNERLRKEAAYLAQFGVTPPPADPTANAAASIDNSPQALIPKSEEHPALTTGPGDVTRATDGGNAPGMTAEPQQETPKTDLESIRDESQRRNDEGGG